MKKNILIIILLALITSCANNEDEVLNFQSSQNFKSSKESKTNSSIMFGTTDPITGEFMNLSYDTNTLDIINYPYIDLYNVAFYDNSFLLDNCPLNDRKCIDLSHLIGKFIIPLEARAIPVFYGEYNSDFNNIQGWTEQRIFRENGSQNLLVTNTWMTDYAVNTVLDAFRSYVKSNYYYPKRMKAFKIYTKEYFGPSRDVIVETKIY